jgi:hypothetical protein
MSKPRNILSHALKRAVRKILASFSLSKMFTIKICTENCPFYALPEKNPSLILLTKNPYWEPVRNPLIPLHIRMQSISAIIFLIQPTHITLTLH